MIKQIPKRIDAFFSAGVLEFDVVSLSTSQHITTNDLRNIHIIRLIVKFVQVLLT
jgi:hypothetical protein